MAQARLSSQPATTETRKHITFAEYALLPDKVEIVNGEIVVISPQAFRSSRVAHDLYDDLTPYVKTNRLGRVWLETVYPLDVDSQHNWVVGSRVPDVSFIRQSKLDDYLAAHAEDEPLALAPDFVVEIVSPTDRATDIKEKVSDYLTHGVRLVWVLYPQIRAARVHTPDQPDGALLDETAILSAEPVLSGWSISLKKLLDGALNSG